MNNKILDVIKNASSVCVVTHESPDGDAIGSILGMSFALEKLGIEADTVVKTYPKMFNILNGIDKFKQGSDKIYDVVITLDCGSNLRVSEQDILNNANTVINIDHHVTNNEFGDYNIVDKGGPACCLTLVDIFKSWGLDIDINIGTSLTMGIITDTSGFKYNNISKTYEFVAEMIKIGVDVSYLYYNILMVNTKGQFELKKIAQNRLEFFNNNMIAFTYITEEDDINLGTGTGDHEGIVDIGQNIEGVVVSIFYRQCEGKYRVSLRSNRDFDVAKIASKFNGGGHSRAAGFITDLTLLDSKKLLIESVIDELNEWNNSCK